MVCNYYAVREGGGRTWGIFTNWIECRASTNRFKKSGNYLKERYGDHDSFKGFDSVQEALVFLGVGSTANPKDYYAFSGRHTLSGPPACGVAPPEPNVGLQSFAPVKEPPTYNIGTPKSNVSLSTSDPVQVTEKYPWLKIQKADDDLALNKSIPLLEQLKAKATASNCKDPMERRRQRDQYIKEEFERLVLPSTQSIQIKQEGGNETSWAPEKGAAPKQPQTPYERFQAYKNLCAKLDRREPWSIPDARRILRAKPYVNIIDLIDNARIGSEVHTFSTVKELKEYTFGTKKIVSLGCAKKDEFRSLFLVDFDKGEDQNDFWRLGSGDHYRPRRTSMENLHKNNSINANGNSMINSNESGSIESEGNGSIKSEENSSIKSEEDSSVNFDENSSITSEGYSPVYPSEINIMDLDGNESKNPNVQDSINPSEIDARDPNESYQIIDIENTPSPDENGSTNPSENDWHDSEVNNSMDLDKNDSNASGTPMQSPESSPSVQSDGIATPCPPGKVALPVVYSIETAPLLQPRESASPEVQLMDISAPSAPEEVASPDVYSVETATQRQPRESASPEVQFLGIIKRSKPARGRGRPRKTPLPTTVQPAGVVKRGRGRPRKVLNNSLISDWFVKV